MGFLIRAAGTPGPTADFWYTPIDSKAASGIEVTPDRALQISVVWACVRVLSETVASLPLIIYRRDKDGARERATGHPLYDTLHDQPNEWQTSMEFREMLQGHCALRGNGYAQIRSTPKGWGTELIPIHPDRVTVDRLTGNRLRYVVKEGDGEDVVIPQGEMFHLKGYSLDGLTGVSVLTVAREAMGLSAALEEHGARMFSQAARPSGVLKHPGQLKGEALERVQRSWQQDYSGLSNAWRVGVLEEGMEWQQTGMTGEDAQWLESRRFSGEDVARFFRVQAHKVGILEHATYTNVEQQAIEFVVDTIRPWLIRWEQGIRKSLILRPHTFFAEHLVDALLLGDTLTRYQAYHLAVSDGWMTRNEIRRRENLNPLDGLDEPKQDVPLPTNLGNTTPEVQAYTRLLATDVAGRVVRREIGAITKGATEHADSEGGFSDWLDEWFVGHADYVARAMQIPPAVAQAYCEERREHLAQQGLRRVDEWEIDAPPRLAKLALEDRMAA